MTKLSKLVLAALSVVFVIALGAGTAAANRSIELSPTENQQATSRELIFSSPEVAGFNITCEVTLGLERLQRATGKVVGNRIGAVTEARVANCRGGSARVLSPTREAPWEITYVSFAGTLPSITSVTLEIRGAAFLTEVASTRCLFRGNPRGSTNGGTRVTEITSSRTSVPLNRDLGGFIPCPRNGSFTGSFRLARTITLRLL